MNTLKLNINQRKMQNLLSLLFLILVYAIEGYGQEAMKELRKEYSRFTKFVLEGFEINEKLNQINY